jgi:transcriptional regulator with XRE-family HTH domain
MTENTIRLRYWRVRRGMTIKQLAQASGVSEAAIVRIEGGQRPHASTLGKLALGLGIELEQLSPGDETLQNVSEASLP